MSDINESPIDLDVADDSAPSTAASPMAEETGAEILKRVERKNAFDRSVGWFYWIGGLSLVNSIAFHMEVDFGFFFGLGVTQLADGIIAGITQEMTGGIVTVIKAIGFLFNMVAAGMCFLFAWAGKRGSMGVYKLGLVLYAFDAVIFLLVADWIGLGFHAFALVMLSSAFKNAPAKIEAVAAASVIASPAEQQASDA